MPSPSRQILRDYILSYGNSVGFFNPVNLSNLRYLRSVFVLSCSQFHVIFAKNYAIWTIRERAITDCRDNGQNDSTVSISKKTRPMATEKQGGSQ